MIASSTATAHLLVVLVRVIGCSLLAVGTTQAALVIDNFGGDPIRLSSPQGSLGPLVIDQTVRSPAEALGGERQVVLNQSFGDFEIGGGTVSLEAFGSYRFDLVYRSESLAGVDLTANGADRFQLEISDNHPFRSIDLQVRLKNHQLGGSCCESSPYLWRRNFGNDSLGEQVIELPFRFGQDRQILTDVEWIELSVAFSADPPGTPTAIPEDFQLLSFGTSGPPIAGDFDRDGTITRRDYQTWRDSYGDFPPAVGIDTNDFSRFSAVDYTVWRDAYDAPDSHSQKVPEPSAAILAGLFMLLQGRRRSAT